MLVDAGSADDVREGTTVVVRTQNREVILARWHDQVYALRNICPHQTMSFEYGVPRDRVLSEAVGTVSDRSGPPVLTCPWHGWDFSLDTGICATDSSCRVRRYEVTVRDGRVLVDLGHAGTVTEPPEASGSEESR